MLFDKYIGIEKCDTTASRYIQVSVFGFTVLALVLITYSPLEYLFKYLGYIDSNGCPLLTLTGFPCPMCGMGRSFWALITHNWHDVFYYNPSGAVVFPLTMLLILSVFILSLFNYRVKLKNPLLKLWYIPVILLIIVWILNVLYGHH